MNKLVSVIIPAYNVEHYVAETIESVLRQDYKNMEIIIIDDGATDSTPEIIQKYAEKDSRIVIVTQKNKGLAGARNSGLEKALGEYICIFDADDIMLPDKISQQVAFLDSHTEYDLVYSDAYHFIDGTQNIYFWHLPHLSKNTYRDLIVFGNYVNPNTVLFRKSVYDRCGGFDQELRSAEDWEYWLNITYHGIRFGYLQKPLTLYRMRGNSLSADRVTMYKTAIDVMEKQKVLPQPDEILTLINEGITKRQSRLVLSYLRKGERKYAFVAAKRNARSIIFFWLLVLIPKQILAFLYAFLQQIIFRKRFQQSIPGASVTRYLKKADS